MRNNRSQNFRLINLEHRPDVITRITQLEQQLNQMIDGEVALIAYVNNEKKE